MSVTKSIVGCVAGILAGRGILDPEAPVSDVRPRGRGSGYDGATVRHLLDMRTGVAFRETYLEPDAEVRVMERSMGWRPPARGRSGRHVRLHDHARHRRPPRRRLHLPVGRHRHARLGGRTRERHAGWPTSSRACCGSRWEPSTTPSITCDPVGSAIHDGGHVGDRPRPGEVRAAAARRRSRRRHRGRPVRRGWPTRGSRRPTYARRSRTPTTNEVLTGGWYRNQFWFVPGPTRDALVCLGIHGQMVYVNRTHPDRRREALVVARAAEHQRT